MTATTGPLLLDPHDVASDESLPPWVRHAYGEFRARLLAPDPPYPCHFGVEGETKDLDRYTYVERSGPGDAGLDRLPATLVEFFGRTAGSPRRHSLVTFFGPPEEGKSLEEYRAAFWDVLAYLRHADPAPWPAEVPEEPDHPRWQMCFAGVRLFVFGGCPAYRTRRSRDLGPGLVMVFQNVSIFKGLEGHTPQGKAAKTKIRNRLLAYDEVAPYEELGAPTGPSVYKWKQYFPNDSNDPVGDVCPLERLEAREIDLT